jgi:hypothetical protein
MSRISAVALLVVAASSINAQVLDNPQPDGFLQTEFTGATVMKLALGLLYDQTTAAVPRWGSGGAGLARRAEWLGAGWTARVLTEYAVASHLRVDTDYHPCECKGFPRRAAHALVEGFLEHRSNGTPVFAVARFAGIASGGLATMPMLPGGYGMRAAAGRMVMAVGVDEGFNMLREFRREIVRTLLLRGNPKDPASAQSEVLLSDN